MYLKNVKIGGKFICQFCPKQYSHSRDLRTHYKKYHIQDIEELPKTAFQALTAFRKNEKRLTGAQFLDLNDEVRPIREYDTSVYKETLNHALTLLLLKQVGI